MAKGKGVGQGLGQKDGTRLKGQWDEVGPWVKGGKGLGHGGDSDITPEIFLGVFYDNLMLIRKGCWSNKCLLFDILSSDLDLPHILNHIF